MSLTKVSYAMITGAPVTPQDYGAVGNGTADDTQALKDMFATNKPWYIPTGTYLFNDTLVIGADGYCDGTLKAATNFNTLAINFADPGYFGKRIVRGLKVEATTTRVTNSVGIRIVYPSIVLDRCSVRLFDYGIQVWSYSVALMNCNAVQCKTNLSAYAPSSISEINDLKIIGGNYDSAAEYSCRIGDPRFSTTVPAGELMGTTVTVIGAAFDAATSTFDRIYSLNIIGCYWEGPANGKAIVLGGAGNGWMRNVTIEGCYFSNVDYPIYCDSAINGLHIGPNYYGGTPVCKLYMGASNVYGFDYAQGVSTNAATAQEVHTGYSSVALSSVVFSNMTIDNDGLFNGTQTAIDSTTYAHWYPYAKTNNGFTQVASSAGRFYSSPATSIAGTFSGSTFTCTTLADSYKFNGGDAISASAGGFTYVRSVNYSTGVLTLDGGTTASGAGTISQTAAYFIGTSLSGTGSPEGAVTANPGSVYLNISGGAGTSLYVKQSGTGNTGWAGK